MLYHKYKINYNFKGGIKLSYENVKLWFAKDENNEIVTIDTINDLNKHNTYYCPVCGSNLKPKAIESKQITPHFAHVDASKCNSESQIHFWFKNKFLEKGDKFTVVSDEKREYIVQDVLVEQSYETNSGLYRPDVTITTECGNTIYFEMDFSNKKKVKDYLDIWLELKNIVVEVDIKQLMIKNEVSTFKALFYDGKCFNVKRNDTYYNTIGKYKEEKLKEHVNIEVKERIRKLDWFWDDILRYEKGEANKEEIFNLIDFIDYSDKSIVKEILRKTRCSLSWDDYIHYKINRFNLEFKNSMMSNIYDYQLEKNIKRNNIEDVTIYFQNRYCHNNSLNFKINLEEFSLSIIESKINNLTNGIEDFMFLVDNSNKFLAFSLKCLKDLLIESLFTLSISICKNKSRKFHGELHFKYIGKYKIGFRDFSIKIHDDMNENEIRKILIDKRSKILEKIKMTIRWHISKKSTVIHEAIEKLNNKYKNVDYKFHFKLNLDRILNEYEPVINFYYDFRYLMTIKISDEMIGTGLVNKFLYNVDKQINDRFIGETCLLKEQEIIKAVDNIEKEYKHFNIHCWKSNPNFYGDDVRIHIGYKKYKNMDIVINKENFSEIMGSVDLEEAIKREIIACIEFEHQYECSHCIECNKELKLNKKEVEFFISKGLYLPKRCKSCRKKRKLNKNN